MAHTWSHEIGSGNRVRCSYKQATLVLCTGNVVAALFMVHALLSPLFLFSDQVGGDQPLWTAEEARRVRESEAEAKRIREINEARLKVVPFLLIERVKEIQAEAEHRIARDIEAEYARQRVAADLAERLKELKNSNNQSNMQALEEWRKKKLEDAKRREEGQGNEAGSGNQEGANKVEVGWDPVHGAIMVDEDKGDEHGRTDGGGPDQKSTRSEDTPSSKPFAKQCNAEYHTDYAGTAVRWGLTHSTDSAADCCQACLDQAVNAKEGDMKCNIWVYCPDEDGCFSPDIYEHKHHECWLKQAEEPKLNFKETYSEDYRQTHPKAPKVVPWISGVISQ